MKNYCFVIFTLTQIYWETKSEREMRTSMQPVAHLGDQLTSKTIQGLQWGQPPLQQQVNYLTVWLFTAAGRWHRQSPAQLFSFVGGIAYS